MAVTSAEIKTLFKTYFDAFSFNFSANQLDAIFAKAELYYFDKMCDQYGLDSEIAGDLSTVINAFSFVPTSSTLDTSPTSTQLPDYYRILRIKPTYVVSGKTYSHTCKPVNAENRYSTWSVGNVKYPRYDQLQDIIRIEPVAETPTLVEGEYMINPPVISFQTADLTTPINLSSKNTQEILKLALIQVGVEQREFDYSATVAQENKSE